MRPPPTSALSSLPHGVRTFHPDAPPVLIDLRANGLIYPGACSVPTASLQERLFELPPPGEWPLELVGSADDLAAARDLLEPKGWRPRVILADDADDDVMTADDDDDSDEPASPYRPNSFLSAALPALELHASDAPGLAVDLGCGSGRDAVFMAETLAASAPQWSVLGIDNHVAALERGRSLARRIDRYHHQPPPSPSQPPPSPPPCASLNFEALDLRKGGLEAALAARPSEPLRMIHGCRWLDLKLLASLPALLAPGGVLLWSTFLDPPDGSAPLKPPFRRSRRLSSGQMRQVVGENANMRVLYDGEGELLTRNEWIPAQFYCAQRCE